MLPEYDFSGGVRGKHSLARQTGYTIKVQKRDGSTLVQHITHADEFKGELNDANLNDYASTGDGRGVGFAARSAGECL
jgi:hypothetical protein